MKQASNKRKSIEPLTARIALFTSIFAAFLLINACVVKPNPTIVQGADHWVVLEAKDTQKVDGKLSWDFQLNHSGRYVIQVITNDELQKPAPIAQVLIGD